MTLLLCGLLLQQAPSAEVVEAVRAYLAGRGSLPSIDIAVAERAVRLAMLRPPKDAGKTVQREVTTEVDAAVRVKYWLSVPEDCSSPRGLLVTLHGQGGDAGDWMKLRLEELKSRDYFVLAPQAGSAGWGHARVGYEHVLAPIRDALAEYPVDADRVWLDGFSMGANGAWQVGSIFPDRFAALAPRGGAPHFVRVNREGAVETKPLYARNVKALPIDWTLGAKDAGLPMESVRSLRSTLAGWGYDLIYKEIPDGGHEWFDGETPRIMEWLKTKRRVVDPAEVRWSGWERAFAQAYWIECVDFSAKESVKTPVKDLDGRLIETRSVFSTELTVTARAVRSSNRVDIRMDGVKEMRVCLNDRLVDLSKPVTVRVNGKETFKGRLEGTVKHLLDEVRRRKDPSFLFPASIVVKSP